MEIPRCLCSQVHSLKVLNLLEEADKLSSSREIHGPGIRWPGVFWVTLGNHGEDSPETRIIPQWMQLDAVRVNVVILFLPKDSGITEILRRSLLSGVWLDYSLRFVERLLCPWGVELRRSEGRAVEEMGLAWQESQGPESVQHVMLCHVY